MTTLSYPELITGKLPEIELTARYSKSSVRTRQRNEAAAGCGGSMNTGLGKLVRWSGSILFLAFALTSCGGGGSSGANPTPLPTQPLSWDAGTWDQVVWQ
jgi:hypothetical protein